MEGNAPSLPHQRGAGLTGDAPVKLKAFGLSQLAFARTDQRRRRANQLAGIDFAGRSPRAAQITRGRQSGVAWY